MSDRNFKTREGYDVWDKLCAIPKYGFIKSPAGAVVKVLDIGSWIDRDEAMRVVDEAQSELNICRSEREALAAELATWKGQATHLSVESADRRMRAEKAEAELSALKAGAGEPVMVIGMYDGEREPHLLSWNAFTVGVHQLYTSPQPSAVQEGYRMVPVHPTDAMLRSSLQYDSIQEPDHPDSRAEELCLDWSLMLAAVPQTQQPDVNALKDHETAALVNELRDVAIKYHETDQLRARLAAALAKYAQGGA
ncbi:hypothetical protein [Pseudomonas sp. TMP25]|uniref:hypothetical protein n=1 Tax=Pseudomonas sp. TMP25 TaxID=3136561 RepID=UPI0031018AF6